MIKILDDILLVAKGSYNLQIEPVVSLRRDVSERIELGKT